eukprot:7931162-Lingulodinium_polyedra.AAC.1
MAGWRMVAAPRARRSAAAFWLLLRRVTPSQFRNTAQVSKRCRTSLCVMAYALLTSMVGMTTPGCRRESR